MFAQDLGVRQYLWRAVDQNGNVLDVLVQSRRHAKAAKHVFGKLMRKTRVPAAAFCRRPPRNW
nr:DDE-type integrase/transposase/recombinase [Rhodococcus erythropolis]